MNKMPILEATLPARDECLFPTQADAVTILPACTFSAKSPAA